MGIFGGGVGAGLGVITGEGGTCPEPVEGVGGVKGLGTGGGVDAGINGLGAGAGAVNGLGAGACPEPKFCGGVPAPGVPPGIG